MFRSAKYIVVLFSSILICAIVLLLVYYLNVSHGGLSIWRESGQIGSLYTIDSDVDNHAIVTNESDPLERFVRKPYENSDILKKIKITLVNSPQKDIQFSNEGSIYASSGIDKQKISGQIEIDVQIDTDYLNTSNNRDRMVSYLILKSIYSFQTISDENLDILVNETIDQYYSEEGHYPFEFE